STQSPSARRSWCAQKGSEFYAVTWTETTIDLVIVEKRAFEILRKLWCLRRRRFAAKNRSDNSCRCSCEYVSRSSFNSSVSAVSPADGARFRSAGGTNSLAG